MKIDLQIKEASEKLKKLKKEKEKLNRLRLLDIEVIDIAEFLHKKLCNQNHVDMCDWYYCEWYDKRLGYSRKKYYEKAKKLLDHMLIYFDLDVKDKNDFHFLKNFIKEFLEIITEF